MRKHALALVLGAGAVLGACSGSGSGTDAAAAQSVIAKVEAGVPIALDDAKKAMPYICFFGNAGDAAFGLFVASKHPEWVSDEALAKQSLDKLCDPSFVITDPNAVLKQAVGIFKTITAKAAG